MICLDFAGGFNKNFSQDDPECAKSQSGWYIIYASCPIIWASKLQTQVDLSTMGAEYISLSSALCEVIPIMQLIEEVKQHGFCVLCTVPYFYCKAFKDNYGTLELARLPEMRSCTKRINTSGRMYIMGRLRYFPLVQTTNL